jgi:hypothetical protein
MLSDDAGPMVLRLDHPTEEKALSGNVNPAC